MYNNLFKGFWQGITAYLILLVTLGAAFGAAIVLIFVK